MIFFLSMLFMNCGIIDQNPIIRLWSQTPGVLPFVDRYNAVQTKYKVEVTYVQSPAEELLLTQSVPDLVLSERLSAPRCAAQLDNLGPLLNRDGVDPKLFYPALLAVNQYQNTSVVLPFSFELPVVIYRKDNFPKPHPLTVSVEELKSMSRNYNKTDKSTLVALGFSPLWKPDFLVFTAALFDVDFRAAEGKPLAWDEKALENWRRFLIGWCDENNGGFAQESEYIRKYLYGAPYRLLQEKKTDYYRISFYHALANDFFNIPEAQKETLDMAWLSRGQKIPVDDAILFFGVPRGSGNRPGAYDFLKWVFLPETQKYIIEENSRENPLTFGVANGFSSLMLVNETYLPPKATFLKGRMPAADKLKFPKPLPETWPKLKGEAVLPWLYDYLAKRTNPVPLKERLK